MGPYPPGEGRVSELYNRITDMEADLRRLDDKWQKSVDDIKATIRSEISELKSEQIKDMRDQIKDMNVKAEGRDVEIRHLQREISSWKAGASAVNWMIRFTIAAVSAIGGVLGYEAIRH